MRCQYPRTNSLFSNSIREMRYRVEPRFLMCRWQRLFANLTAVELWGGVFQAEMDSKDGGHQEPKRRRFITEKNATPGDGARSLEACLEDIRPHAICVDRTTSAASDPQTQREGGLERFGDLHIQTGHKEINQFCTKYFSQVLPFVFHRWHQARTISLTNDGGGNIQMRHG